MHKSGEGESHLEKLPTKTISINRKARHEYFVEESFEAGIELFGTEVKSLRAGSCNLKDSWCDIKEVNCGSNRCTLRHMNMEISSTGMPTGSAAS